MTDIVKIRGVKDGGETVLGAATTRPTRLSVFTRWNNTTIGSLTTGGQVLQWK